MVRTGASEHLSNQVKWVRGKGREDGTGQGKENKTQKQQLSNNCFLQYVQSPAGRASRYSDPSGPGVTRAHAHDGDCRRPRGPPPALPQPGRDGGGQGWWGEPGRPRAEVASRPGGSHTAAGAGRGPESPCPGAPGSGFGGAGALHPGTGLAQPQVPPAEPKCACSSLSSARSLGKSMETGKRGCEV